MPIRGVETRAVTLVDLPLIRRLSDKAVALDSETDCTREMHGPNSTILSSMLPQRGIHTMVARSDKQQVVGQFYLRGGDYAQAMYVAPNLEEEDDDTLWLHIFDAMAREAGKYKAHALIAEIEEASPLFETMRTCGFSVYARQQIWRREAGDFPRALAPIELREKQDADVIGIQSLIANTIPPLMQQLATPPDEMPGWVYRNNDRTDAFIGVSEGKLGIYLTPFIHPDIMDEAAAVIESAIFLTRKSDELAVFAPVRRYQDWIATPLEALQFEPGPRQAVMVRHLTAGVRRPAFSTATQEIQAIPAGKTKPPTMPLVRQRLHTYQEINVRTLWNGI
jgi:hypothetical protein